MAYDLDEQEQIDQLRAWWAKYGTAVLTALDAATVAAALDVGASWDAVVALGATCLLVPRFIDIITAYESMPDGL